MPERFTETLRAASEVGWSHAVQHRFVNELFAGAVPDAVMARYLIQDHRFLGSFLVLLGAALASADTFAARLRFGRFIGMVSAEETAYFLRAFAALGVTETRRAADPDTQPTIGFKAIMREAADTRSYAAALSVLVVAEWLYLDWASRAPQPLPNNFVHAEWITGGRRRHRCDIGKCLLAVAFAGNPHVRTDRPDTRRRLTDRGSRPRLFGRRRP